MDNISQDQLDDLSAKTLKSLINRGIIEVTMTTKSLPETIEETPEYKKHADLKGQKISISEAGRKYDIPQQTISRWKDRGIIPVLDKGKNRRIFLDESYVAYCAEVYNKRPGAGRWLFDEKGLPYVPETT
jgi:hypothetical protein